MRSEIFRRDGRIVATMTFDVSSIVAKAITEPMVVGHIRASIRVPQCLKAAQAPHDVPTNPHPTPSPSPPQPSPGVVGLEWALDCMILVFYGFNSEMFATCFTACILRLQNVLSMVSTRYISRMLTGRSLSR